MAWMLWSWILEQLYQLDVIKLAITGAKSGGTALGTYLLKRIWRWYKMPCNESKCMVPRCNGFKGTGMKGLCTRCYGKAKKKIEAGETTWDELGNMGLCEVQDDPFSQAFNKAKESE